jgi:hypothetical protein
VLCADVRSRLRLLDQLAHGRSGALVLGGVAGRRGVLGADAAVEPAAVGDAQVAKGQVVGEKLAIGEMERQGQVGNTQDLADLMLHIRGRARSMHTQDEGLDCRAEDAHMEAMPGWRWEMLQDRKIAAALAAQCVRDVQRLKSGIRVTGQD